MRKQDIKIVVAFSLIVFFFICGTLFYHHFEGWSYIDSFYFTGVTLTTVGYGDFTPTTDISKIATIFFALSGIGMFLYAIETLGRKYFERREEGFVQMIKKNHISKMIKKNHISKMIKKNQSHIGKMIKKNKFGKIIIKQTKK